MTPRDEVRILKIGGSLSTARGAYRTARPDRIQQLAAALAAWHARYRHRAVVIVGGGSFGHDVAARFGIDPAGGPAPAAGLFELTEALFEVKSLYARALRDHGADAMPLQETFLFAERAAHGGKPSLHVSDSRPLNACFASGMLALVTGGVVPADGGFVARSSDDLVRPLAAALAVRRVVLFTDGPGIVRDGDVVARVAPDEAAALFAHITPPAHVDVTGGMRGKLQAAMEVVADGVEVLIADGRALDAEAIERSFSSGFAGTLLLPSIERQLDN